MTKTSQVRGIPEQAYETIRARAEADGRSVSAYVREQLIAMAARRTKAEVIAEIEAGLARSGGSTTMADIVADVEAGRRGE